MEKRKRQSGTCFLTSELRYFKSASLQHSAARFSSFNGKWKSINKRLLMSVSIIASQFEQFSLLYHVVNHSTEKSKMKK
jgi:hypothetical protein